MPNFVQQYRSSNQSSWPALEGTAGSLIALLDAILVNGGTTQSVTGITESGTTYTATIGADSTLSTGTYITISGGSPAGVNVTAQITVVNSTSFTYQGPGSLGTITGTILYKRAGLGWTKPYTGTNLAAFLPQVVTDMPQFYLRIDETGGTAGGQKECAVRGYATMSDINTGTDPFPTVAQLANGTCWRKSTTADGTDRGWFLVGDGSTFYMIINSDNSPTLGRAIIGFGGFPSYKVSDAYNGFLSGNSTFNTGSNTSAFGAGACGLAGTVAMSAASFTLSGVWVTRSYSQTGGCVSLAPMVIGTITGSIGALSASMMPYPASIDAGMWVMPVWVQDTAQAPRGRLPGIYSHMHTSLPMAEYDTATNVLGLSGVTLTAVAASNSNGGGTAVLPFFDTTGPWT